MRTTRSRSGGRIGVIVPLIALLLPAIIAFLALGVDMGYIMLVDGELQNAADSAAHAGASQLLDDSILAGAANMSAVTTSTVLPRVRTEAQKFAKLNYAGGTALDLDANNSNSPSGETVVGNLSNPSNQQQALDFITYPYNAVQVRVHRDNTRNSPLPLFFARAIGVQSLGMSATATAAYSGNIRGFKMTDISGNAPLLPFAMDINAWNQMITGSTGLDDFSRVRPPSTYSFPSFFPLGNVSTGSDGIAEGNLFPLATNLSSGNFGMVALGPPTNATPTYLGWVYYGLSSSDAAYFTTGNGYANGFQLDSVTHTMQLEGTPGVHAALESALLVVVGQPRIIPLYSNVAPNGSNAIYTIVGFGGCTVLDAVLNNPLATKHVRIQPCFTITSTAVTGGGSGAFVYQPLAIVR